MDITLPKLLLLILYNLMLMLHKGFSNICLTGKCCVYHRASIPSFFLVYLVPWQQTTMPDLDSHRRIHCSFNLVKFCLRIDIGSRKAI